MKLITTCFLVLFAISNVFAGTIRQIELNDGSLLKGEIVSFNNGVYTIKSSFGLLKIEDSKIRSIHSGKVRVLPSKSNEESSAREPRQIKLNEESNELMSAKVLNKKPSLPFINSGLQAIQGMILNSPDILEMILSLQNDSDLQAALQDPLVMDAVMSGDINALRTHPKFKKLLENPKVIEIIRKIEEK